MFVNQDKYCENLEDVKIDLRRKLKINKLLNEDEKKELKAAAGKLLWAVSQTRPDMAFQTCQVTNAGSHPTVKTLLETNKAIRKMRNEQLEILYPPLGDSEKVEVVVYSDGSHDVLPNGNSGSLYCFPTGTR